MITSMNFTKLNTQPSAVNFKSGTITQSMVKLDSQPFEYALNEKANGEAGLAQFTLYHLGRAYRALVNRETEIIKQDILAQARAARVRKDQSSRSLDLMA